MKAKYFDVIITFLLIFFLKQFRAMLIDKVLHWPVEGWQRQEDVASRSDKNTTVFMLPKNNFH